MASILLCPPVPGTLVSGISAASPEVQPTCPTAFLAKLHFFVNPPAFWGLVRNASPLELFGLVPGWLAAFYLPQEACERTRWDSKSELASACISEREARLPAASC